MCDKTSVVVKFDCCVWITVTTSGCGGIEQANAYRLVPLRMFEGEPTTYNGKTGTAEGASAARGDPTGFYHGMKVHHGKEDRVLQRSASDVCSRAGKAGW
jgi:hypothetical protein